MFIINAIECELSCCLINEFLQATDDKDALIQWKEAKLNREKKHSYFLFFKTKTNKQQM